jgi:prevent-host-death family protein
MMARVGIRDLRDHLSRYLKQVKAGERVVVTERGKAIALLVPAEPAEQLEGLDALVREGLARWGGGKPQGAAQPAKVRGQPVAEIVLQERE